MRLARLRSRRRRGRGQALVEFALVIPIFLTLVISMFEFTFLFTSYVDLGYATHDASQLAAEMGNTTNADTAILQRIDNDINVPADPTRIVSVDIYWVNTATKDASPVSGAENIYLYVGGSHPFYMPDGTTIIYLPFAPSTSGYPPNQRCNVNGGIGCLPTGAKSHTTVDTIAVKISYQYAWVTPLPGLIGGGTTGPLLTSINVMRLEPVL